jgi:hypothetical protein
MRQLFIILIFFVANKTWAQSFSINTDGTTAHASAMLEIKSDAKGFLMPRMTKLQKNAIVTPAAGLLVFQSSPDSIGFHYFDGTKWLWLEALINSNTAWKTSGNTGTTTANFIGTTDNKPIEFRQNNKRLGLWNSSAGIYAIGDSAAANNTSGSPIAIGSYAGYSNTTADGSIYLGNYAGYRNTSAPGIIAIGDSALYSNTSSQMIAIGNRAGRNHTSFISNIFIGQSAGYNDSIGNVNLFIGDFAGFNNKGLNFPQGSNNTFLGMSAGRGNTIGQKNTFVGNGAGLDNETGSDNTFLGRNSGSNNVAGFNNTALGINTSFDESFGPLTNATVIGINAQVSRSNAIVLGSINGVNGSSQDVNVGIGTTTPIAKLHIANGNVFFTGSATLPITPSNLPVNGAGTRMMWYPDKAAFRTGGVLNTNWNKDSIGIYSFASGFDNKASGAYSTAMGNTTTASGDNSTAMGNFTTARANGSLSIGRYNDSIITSSPIIWVSSDPVFIIGNGSANNNRSNAFVVYKNGNTDINGNLKINNGSATTGDVLTATDNLGNSNWQAINQNPVIGFSANLSGDVSIANNSFVNLVFNTESVDDGGNNFSTATGIYTAPSAGMYQFEVSVYWNGLTATENLYLVINGVRTKFTSTPVATGILHTQKLSAFVKLNTGDQVRTQLQQNSGAAILINNAAGGTYFSGVKLY